MYFSNDIWSRFRRYNLIIVYCEPVLDVFVRFRCLLKIRRCGNYFLLLLPTLSTCVTSYLLHFFTSFLLEIISFSYSFACVIFRFLQTLVSIFNLQPGMHLSNTRNVLFRHPWSVRSDKREFWSDRRLITSRFTQEMRGMA